MKEQMELFNEGGLRDEGGTVEPESGNEVPSGSLQKEVADDIPIMISEGEFVFPADVVRYIGLNTLMKMRQDAKQGLKMMEKMGQMGNPEEAEIPDDMPFGMADLIVIGSDDDEEEEKDDSDVKEMQTGGLLDDPRFQRPTGGQTPTIDDTDKKEIEDALLGTVYGTITMKRYVNADGMVKYIPFIGDEPQMAIPEGFELDNSAPTPTNTTVTSISEDRGGDSGPSATPYSQLNPNLNPFKNQGTANFNIDNLDANQLVDYYGSFSSPMNRFLSVGVGALFGGLPALGIATMQQFAQTKGPNSLKATEDKLAQMVKNGEISGDLLDKLKAFQKRAKQKGTGPRSFLSKLIGGVSEGDSKKADTLTKAVQAGAVNTVSEELKQVVDQSAKQALNSALFSVGDDISLDEPEVKNNSTLINTVGGLVDIAPTATFESMRDKRSKEAADRTAAMSEFARQVPSAVTSIRTDDITTEDALAKATGTEAYRTAFGLENFGRTPVEGTRFEVGRSPYEAEGRSQLGSGFKSPEEILYTRGFNPEDIGTDPALEQEFKDKVGGKTKKRTRKVEQPRTGILPRRGERFPDVGLDRPSKFGQTRVDDFLLGVQRDDKGNVSNLTEQQQKNIRQNVQEQENIRQKLDQEDRERQSRGFGPMGVQERFDRQQQEFTGFDSQGNFLGGAKGGTFYVGGVPTKPMKPQRLKKGGLAKPKVKPKRMKKGGLASKKK
tara:strand:- start:602 stop:2764 length:2163 start_codon:yes stop_codon:yes gene_type:complete